MASTTSLLRGLLPIPHAIAKAIGYTPLENVMKGFFKLGDGLFPLWTRHIPSGSKKIQGNLFPGKHPQAPEVVYFPACITRTMGSTRGPSPGSGTSAGNNTSAGSNEREDVSMKMLSILRKAGYTVIIPEEKDKLCCGMAFSSKGFRKQAAKKERELNSALMKASRHGELPIVCDMSPCLLHMRETLDSRLKLYDQVEFIHDHLLDKLHLVKQPITVAVHTTCSSTKMQLQEKLYEVASRCADKVVMPNEVECCGWAGDRGFFYPELNRSALELLRDSVAGADEGYSNSRTCEIGLSMNSGITYRSLVYLVDKAATSSGRTLRHRLPPRCFAR